MIYTGKFIDLTGQKFGELTVLSRGADRVSKSGRRRTYYECVCDCGNFVYVRGDDLTGGRKTSCGGNGKHSVQNKTMLPPEADDGMSNLQGRPIEDLTGVVFGELEVLERDQDHVTKKGKNVTQWKCMCSCGRIISVSRQTLINGKKTTCGRSGKHRDSINIGDTFGPFTVVGSAPPLVGADRRARTAWRCKCQNGMDAVVSGEKLRSGLEKLFMRSILNTKKDLNNNYVVKKLESIVGMRFGRITVIKRIKDHKKQLVLNDGEFECLCDCGNTAIIKYGSIINNEQLSCGCLDREIEAREKEKSKLRARLRGVWRSMKRRCYDDTFYAFDHYGGRGITVCDEWRDNFDAFLEWAILTGYDPNAKFGECTLDRIDNNWLYSPENCRWTNMTHQQQNKRTNLMIQYKGKEQCLSAWCLELGLNESTVRHRIADGWTVERAFETPVGHARPANKYFYNGEEKTIYELAYEYGLTYGMLKSRLRRGWSIEEALTGARDEGVVS